MKRKLGVLVSGSGTNLQAILDASKEPNYPAEVVLVISNVPGVRALERAHAVSVPMHVISHEGLTREAFEEKLIQSLDTAGIDFVILAGFMRILSPVFIRHYKGRILNIHPALLPAFPGTHAIEQAWKSGSKITGVTVHFVDEGVDTGPIILQKEVPIDEKDDLASLEEKVHAVEHRLYPEAVRLVISGKVVMP